MGKYLFRNKLIGDVQKKREERTIPYAPEADKTLVECLQIEMEQDEMLKNFFVVLDRHIHRIRAISGAEYEREARKMHELVKKFAAKRTELVARLRAAGITMVENYVGPSYDLNVFGSNFGEDRQIYDYTYTFNGIRLTKEMLTNPNDTTYKDKYEKQKAENVERAKRLKELKRQLRVKRIIGFAINEELENIKDEIFTLESNLEAEPIFERQYLTFKNLSTGQKEGIIQYLEATEAIDKGVRTIKLLQEQFERAKPDASNPEVLEEAFDRMQANGMIGEDVEEVMKKIDDVAQKRKLGFYDKKRKATSYRSTTINAFIKQAYGFDEEMEKAMKRNLFEFDER